jgi:hypothetical protein
MLLCVLLLLTIGCTIPLGQTKTDDGNNDPVPVPDPILDRDYRGVLRLQVTNVFPAFNETTDCEAYVDHQMGIITFDPATLSYLGDETNDGGLRVRRDGTLDLGPTGHFEDLSGVIYVQVKENTDVQEHLQVWAPDGTLQIDETISDFWDGGLSFDFLDAQTGGSVCQASNPQGGSVTWTLALTPAIVP